MPWYLSTLDCQCNSRGCTRAATRGLFNAVNAPSGRYCERHAKAALEAAAKS